MTSKRKTTIADAGKLLYEELLSRKLYSNPWADCSEDFKKSMTKWAIRVWQEVEKHL